MDDLDAGLMRRARRGYETGRFATSLRRGVLILPAAGLASLGCADPGGTLAAGAILFAIVVFCLWRGQDFRHGVGPGLVAGCVPFLLPIVVQASGHVCCAGACLLLPAICGLGGLVGGVALGILAPRPRHGRRIAFVTACLVAGLAGSMGCLLYGTIGLGVMLIGLLLGAAPALATRRA